MPWCELPYNNAMQGTIAPALRASTIAPDGGRYIAGEPSQ